MEEVAHIYIYLNIRSLDMVAEFAAMNSLNLFSRS